MSEETLPPRTKHNADLSAKFIDALKVTARYPKVSQQVETIPLQPGKLVKHGYNPSIVEFEGGMLMAYRYHDGPTLSTRIALAQVGFDGQVWSNRTLSIPCDGQSVEDPKLYLREGQVWICWVQSTWPNQPITAVVRYGRVLEDGNVVDVHQPAIRNPKPIEKNWCPMEGQTFIYESEPQQLALDFAGEKLVEYRAASPRWPYGPVRGGTPPIAFEGKLLRFFHSGLDNEFDGWRRRYFIGAALHHAEPPYPVEHLSTTPIVYGSELDDLPLAQRGECLQYKGRVVFPGGAVAHDDHFILSVGINDSACLLLKLRPENLHL